MTLNYMKYCDVDLEMISPSRKGEYLHQDPPLSGQISTQKDMNLVESIKPVYYINGVILYG
jgi:hypothetical protein